MNVFVTGTDTGCGKTYVCAALLRRLAALDVRAAGMKPIASGATRHKDVLTNEDVETLRAAATVALPAAAINPYIFEPPASPHLAAAATGEHVELERIVAAYVTCREAAEVVVVEGVGGWAVPLADDIAVPDLARALALPVVLVVGVRLGCINHALLTGAAIAASGLVFHGWIANVLEPDLYALDGVIETIALRLPAPLLATLSPGDDGRSLDSLANALARPVRP